MVETTKERLPPLGCLHSRASFNEGSPWYFGTLGRKCFSRVRSNQLLTGLAEP